MLKNLLKYEFRATARTYGGIYLALLAAAGLIGFSLRGDRVAAQSHVFEIGVTIYSLLVMALVIVTIVTVIQRFTKNLLGREGYLMHTLPVTEAQLVGSKLISSAVWLLASAVVGVVSLVVMFCVGADFTWTSAICWMIGQPCGRALWEICWRSCSGRPSCAMSGRSAPCCVSMPPAWWAICSGPTTAWPAWARSF